MTRVSYHATDVEEYSGIFKIAAVFIQDVYDDLPELDMKFTKTINSFAFKSGRDRIMN